MLRKFNGFRVKIYNFGKIFAYSKFVIRLFNVEDSPKNIFYKNAIKYARTSIAEKVKTAFFGFRVV